VCREEEEEKIFERERTEENEEKWYNIHTCVNSATVHKCPSNLF
jgi:hypothetical protein